MRRTRLTITLKDSLISDIDQLIDGKQIRNRSHAIEYILSQYIKPTIGKAVILAGGKGKNLKSDYLTLPKPLMPVKGKPILEHLIENLKEIGVEEIVICLGHQGEKIKQYFADGKRFGVKIDYSEEETPLGTGGAIKKIRSFLAGQSFLILHGDVFILLNLKDLINFHKEQETVGTVALTSIKNPSRLGQLKLHGTKIVNFYSKTKKGEEESNLVNTGVYIFNKEIFQYFPQSKTVFMLEDILGDLVKERKLSGFVFENQWFDVGLQYSLSQSKND